MLDDIYVRLFLEVIPDDVKLHSLDIRQLIEQHKAGQDGNSHYGRLINLVYLQNPDSDIGLQFGHFLHPSTLCDFSRMLMTANSLQEGLQLIQRLHYIHGASYFPRIYRHKGKCSIALTYPYKKHINACQRRFCAESVFSYALNAVHDILDAESAPLSVQFDFSPPGYDALYASRFGIQCEFNQPLSIIEFDESLLFKKLSTASPTLHQMYQNKCFDSWRTSEKLQDFEYRVISYIMLHHPESFNSQQLASKLNISTRGLQKRLSKYGGSFSHLATLARRELTKAYLIQEQQSIDFTAEQLGFQTLAGFRRFFKNEFDQTPSEFMQQRVTVSAA